MFCPELFKEFCELPCVSLEGGKLSVVPTPGGKPNRVGYQNLCRLLHGAPSKSEKEKKAEKCTK